MRVPRGLWSSAFALVGALTLVGSACDSGGSNGPSNPLIGGWDATSFTAQGTDFIAIGMSVVLTFEQGGTYTVAFTNDLIGACNPGPDCADGGDFVRTGNQVTLDPGTVDETVFTYAIQGSTLTLTGDINGAVTTIVLAKL
ncbi:MAG: hypothetical protein E4H38_04370 [Gemmatimonadales bacterium]|nr:MAG: hypothetical protein E4H38_04370 [Gemmatimonadales bacterium]